MNPTRQAHLEGAVWMVLAGAAFAGVNTLEQIATVQAGLPAPTAAFLQYLVAFIVVIPWAVRRGISQMKTRNPGLHALRVVLSALGVQFWVAGLAHAVPIGTASTRLIGASSRSSQAVEADGLSSRSNRF